MAWLPTREGYPQGAIAWVIRRLGSTGLEPISSGSHRMKGSRRPVVAEESSARFWPAFVGPAVSENIHLNADMPGFAGDRRRPGPVDEELHLLEPQRLALIQRRGPRWRKRAQRYSGRQLRRRAPSGSLLVASTFTPGQPRRMASVSLGGRYR